MIGSLRFRLIDLARGTHTVSLLATLRRNQYQSRQALAVSENQQLNSYFNDLRKTVPLFSQVARFEDLPVLDKRFINAHRDQLINASYQGKRVRKKTGGSTGEPLVYFTGIEAQSYLWAGLLLSWEAAGYRLGEKVAFLAGSSLFGTGYKQRLYYRLLNVTVMNAFDLSEQRLRDYAAQLGKGGFRLLYGYASAIHRMARLHLDAGQTLPNRLRGVVCTAETLTPAMRADIEQAFGVPCFSQYGCHDAGVSAFECEQRDGFHLISSRCHAEVLDDGRLVATDVTNRAMFMPRYDTGDLVQMSGRSCACGRGLPLIDKVIGRQNDIVTDPAGAVVHSELFTHMFREDGRIQAFQIVFDEQELRVNLHGAQLDQAALAGLEQQYRGRIEHSLRFPRLIFELNAPFVTLPNSKHRFVIRRSATATPATTP
ncbi:phenylacetate--CoA ligase family protein [Duganella radicis]|uniref:Phenylacetate--CoA ligase family protein n=1 Tax=Duganella radicis TaxID=551988 RepID=A0A6L6PRY6_9BURK|nr:phenylacetate--CoA ligase family protein [Duganella radicis]MTV41549.1 hypothetical protein [Duganella radicis]